MREISAFGRTLWKSSAGCSRDLAQRAGDHDDFVFTAPNGGPLRHTNFYGRHFKPGVARAGIVGRGPRAALIDVPAVAEMLGVTERHFLRFDPIEVGEWLQDHRRGIGPQY